MAEIRMELSDSFFTWERRIRQVAEAGEHAFYETVDRLAELITEQAKQYAAVNTGEMREAIIWRAERTGEGYSAIIEAGKGLMYVEFGTGLRALETPKNGLPKSPNSLPPTMKSTWYIPASKLSGQQYDDLKNKYHFRMWENSSGEEFFICHGQAPQPFMYPAALEGADKFNDLGPMWFSMAFMKLY